MYRAEQQEDRAEQQETVIFTDYTTSFRKPPKTPKNTQIVLKPAKMPENLLRNYI